MILYYIYYIYMHYIYFRSKARVENRVSKNYYSRHTDVEPVTSRAVGRRVTDRATVCLSNLPSIRGFSKFKKPTCLKKKKNTTRLGLK